MVCRYCETQLPEYFGTALFSDCAPVYSSAESRGDERHATRVSGSVG
jgi:hypothetical protein